MCKVCRSTDDAVNRNPEKRLADRNARKAIKREWTTRLKVDNPCVDCGGYFHHAAMHWDHVGTDKVKMISAMVAECWSDDSILKEIAKCELVCANCHAVRTHRRYLEGKCRVAQSGGAAV